MPLGQSSHLLLFFTLEYFPGEHRVHPSSFPEVSRSTRDPASHPSNTQAVLLLVPFVPKPMPCTSSQLRHSVDPLPAENVPGKHKLHSAPLGSLRYEPAAQGVHDSDASFEYFPFSHEEHSSSPSSLVNLPPGQS